MRSPVSNPSHVHQMKSLKHSAAADTYAVKTRKSLNNPPPFPLLFYDIPIIFCFHSKFHEIPK